MPTPKAARTPISAVGSTTPVSTTALETTTCQRRGTAAMVSVIVRAVLAGTGEGAQDADQEHGEVGTVAHGQQRVTGTEPTITRRW